MKNILLVVLFAVFTLFFAGESFACDDGKPRLGFNVGTDVASVGMYKFSDEKGKNITPAINVHGATGDYLVAITLGDNSNFTLKIFGGPTYKGTYAATSKCLDTSFIVDHWDDQKQEKARVQVDDQIRWVTSHGSHYQLYYSDGFKLFITNSADEILYKWNFRVDTDQMKIWINNKVSIPLKGSPQNPNQVVFVSYRSDEGTFGEIKLTSQEVSGRSIDYRLNREGQLKQ